MQVVLFQSEAHLTHQSERLQCRRGESNRRATLKTRKLSY
jgi:hypothetical protein